MHPFHSTPAAVRQNRRAIKRWCMTAVCRRCCAPGSAVDAAAEPPTAHAMTLPTVRHDGMVLRLRCRHRRCCRLDAWAAIGDGAAAAPDSGCRWFSPGRAAPWRSTRGDYKVCDELLRRITRVSAKNVSDKADITYTHPMRHLGEQIQKHQFINMPATHAIRLCTHEWSIIYRNLWYHRDTF